MAGIQKNPTTPMCQTPKNLNTFTCTHMFMATKTLTIMEDAYGMLKAAKTEDESFSEALRRVLSPRRAKSLKAYFGILSEEEGQGILDVLKENRKKEIELLKKRPA